MITVAINILLAIAIPFYNYYLFLHHLLFIYLLCYHLLFIYLFIYLSSSIQRSSYHVLLIIR